MQAIEDYADRSEFYRVSRGTAVTIPKEKIATLNSRVKCKTCDAIVPPGSAYYYQSVLLDGYETSYLDIGCQSCKDSAESIIYPSIEAIELRQHSRK
jgi:Zn finger protein HypA/HybF involved in hydrogenase expression